MRKAEGIAGSDTACISDTGMIVMGIEEHWT